MSNCEGNVYHIGMGCCVPKIANPDLYYTKEEVDEKIDDIEVSGITEEKAEEMIDNALEGYASKDWVSGYTYDKQTIEDMIEEGGGFIPENYYNKTATDALLANKANTATTYTKTEVNNAISAAISGKVDSSVVDSLSDYVDTINEDVETISGNVSSIKTTLDTYFDESAKVSEFDYKTSNDYIELKFPYWMNQGDAWDDETQTVKIDAATKSSAGVMSASDKEKLNDTYTKSEVDSAITEAISGAIPSLDGYATKAYVSGYTYDKQTIDNMIEESGGVIVDSALSTTSENPVQNKVITNAINNLDGNISNLEDGISNLENTFVERIKVPSTISASANSRYMTLNIPYLYGWDNDISYETNEVEFSAATSGSAGVMSADDKTKLDGLLKTWSGTQAEYDAITEKDNNTVYYIKEG